MKRKDLLKNEGYWLSKIQMELYNQLEDYMKANKLNQSRMAKKLGVSKGYISQILNGDSNHRLSKLVELSLAINKAPEISFKDLEQMIQEETDGFKSVSWEVKINKSSNLDLITAEQSGQCEKSVGYDYTVKLDNTFLKVS